MVVCIFDLKDAFCSGKTVMISMDSCCPVESGKIIKAIALCSDAGLSGRKGSWLLMNRKKANAGMS
jgi:hypothetical protein